MTQRKDLDASGNEDLDSCALSLELNAGGLRFLGQFVTPFLVLKTKTQQEGMLLRQNHAEDSSKGCPCRQTTEAAKAFTPATFYPWGNKNCAQGLTPRHRIPRCNSSIVNKLSGETALGPRLLPFCCLQQGSSPVGSGRPCPWSLDKAGVLSVPRRPTRRAAVLW